MNRRDFLKISGATIAYGSLISCSSSPKVTRTFPVGLEGQFYGELNRAENIIKSVGVHKIKPKNVEARLIPGQKKFGNAWAWLVVYPGFPKGLWVLGLCYGRLIEVGKNPRPGDLQIDYSTVNHELVHHWLMQNGHGGNHFPEYDKLVDGWAYARKVTGRNMEELEYNPILITDKDLITEEDLRKEYGTGQIPVLVDIQGKKVAIDAYIPEESDIETRNYYVPTVLDFKL